MKCLITYTKVTLITGSIEDNSVIFNTSHPVTMCNYVKIDKEYTPIL